MEREFSSGVYGVWDLVGEKVRRIILCLKKFVLYEECQILVVLEMWFRIYDIVILGEVNRGEVIFGLSISNTDYFFRFF